MAGIISALIGGLGAPIVNALAQRYIVGPFEQEMIKNKMVNYPVEARGKLTEQSKSMMSAPEFNDYQTVARSPVLQSIWANLTPEPASMMRSSAEAQAVPTAIDVARSSAGLKQAEAERQKAEIPHIGAITKQLEVQTQWLPKETQAKINLLGSQAGQHNAQAEALKLNAPQEAEYHRQQAAKLAQEAKNLADPTLNSKLPQLTGVSSMVNALANQGMLTQDQVQQLYPYLLNMFKGASEKTGAKKAAPTQVPLGQAETLMDKYRNRR